MACHSPQEEHAPLSLLLTHHMPDLNVKKKAKVVRQTKAKARVKALEKERSKGESGGMAILAGKADMAAVLGKETDGLKAAKAHGASRALGTRLPGTKAHGRKEAGSSEKQATLTGRCFKDLPTLGPTPGLYW